MLYCAIDNWEYIDSVSIRIMHSNIKNLRHRAPRSTAIKTIVFLFVAAQTLAAPIHFISDLTPQTDANYAASDCPMHGDSADAAGGPKSCECSGGGCCDASTDRSTVHAISDTNTKSVQQPTTLFTAATIELATRRITSSTQSRAPPAYSPV